MIYSFNSPYILPLFAAALISLLISIYAWLYRQTPSAIALTLLGMTIAQWSFGYALEIAGADLPTKIFWGKAQYIGIATAPLFWLIFAFNHGHQGSRLSHWRMMFLAGIPILTILLAFTTEQHGWLWKTMDVLRAGNFSALKVTYGFWFWVHFAYSYLLLAAGAWMVLRFIWKKEGLYRGQAAALIVAVLAPWAANALYLSGHSPIPYLDITPFAFTLTVAGLAWGIFGFRLVDISPIAREQVLEGMREGMIVLDLNARIIDINPAAARMIGLPGAQMVGKPIAEALAPWPNLLERFQGQVDIDEVIAVGTGAARRHYRVQISPLLNRQGTLVGRLITARPADQEITPQAGWASQPSLTTPLPANQPQPAPASAAPPQTRWQRITSFFLPPLRPELPAPAGINPNWHQALERAFTSMLRVAALAGTLELLLTLPYMKFSQATLIYGLIVACIWWAGLARATSFAWRSNLTLLLIYGMAFIESWNYGYSVEGFTFLLTYLVLSVLLRDLKGGLLALLISLLTLGIFGWQISLGHYVPPLLLDEDVLAPANLQAAITSMVAFAASGLALIVAVISLLRSVNLAWQKETQTRNLLQQERDLLEQRVTHRTHDLAEARDRALKASDELHKYFLAIEQSGNSIVITDLEGRIEYVNPRFEKVTGYSRQEALGKNPRLLKSGKQPYQLYVDLWKTISAGEIWQGEFQNRRKDNSLYWESATIAPVKTSSGEITHYIAIKEDISLEKQLREELQIRQQEQQALAALLLIGMKTAALDDLLPLLLDEILAISWLKIEAKGGIFLADASQQRLTLQAQRNLSPQIQSLCQQVAFGQCLCGRAAAQGKILFFPAVDHQHETTYAGMPDHGHYNIPILTDNGVLGVLVLYLAPGYQPQPSDHTFLQAATSTLSAILQRQNAETSLRESEERFRQIVENASDLIYRTDAQGRFTYANPTALHALGFEQESEVLGRHYLELALPQARHNLKRFYDHQYLARQITTYYEFPALNAEGQVVWIGQNVRLLEENGQVTGFQAVARDITALKQARDALALSRNQALEASRFKSQLLAKVSHELRTPLGGVIGYAELLEQEAFGALTSEQKDAAENIVNSANYLNIMINELLDQAQIESKSMQIRRAPFAPADLLGQIDTIIRPLARHKNLALFTRFDPSLPATLMGDAQRLQQMLINLAGNAVKFTSAGEIKIELLRLSPTRWALRVSDTGAGIPPEAQKYVFEPFRQVENAITRDNRGTGLGLSITQQIVEMMGGEIHLESEVGRGSVFTITLPLEEKENKA